MEAFDTTMLHTGLGRAVTVTMTLAIGPVPLGLIPLTEYAVVEEGDTSPEEAALPNAALGDHK